MGIVKGIWETVSDMEQNKKDIIRLGNAFKHFIPIYTSKKMLESMDLSIDKTTYSLGEDIVKYTTPVLSIGTVCGEELLGLFLLAQSIILKDPRPLIPYISTKTVKAITYDTIFK